MFNLQGYKRDNLDPRDYKFQALPKLQTRPIDLRRFEPSIIDQGNLGSCTACAATSMIQFVRKKTNKRTIQPSILFTYYTTRQIERTVAEDAGATLRNAIKSTVNYGVTLDSLCPYVISEFATPPSPAAYSEALKYQTLKYYRLNNASVSTLQKCLNEGYPFVFGFAVYSNFWADTNKAGAYVNLPSKTNSFEGGHAVMAIGWERYKNQNYFICKNSWGSTWGDKGYFRLPEKYITNTRLAADFWTIRSTE